MRPQDIVILLKVVAMDAEDWRMKDVAASLQVSPSEVTESLERSALAGLINREKRSVMRGNLLEFLVHGLRYVFPVHPGPVRHGIFTAHSAEPLSSVISAAEHHVWEMADGPHRGSSIAPLIPTAPMAALRDAALYQMLALCDALRVGRVREQNLAEKHLEELLWKTPTIA